MRVGVCFIHLHILVPSGKLNVPNTKTPTGKKKHESKKISIKIKKRHVLISQLLRAALMCGLGLGARARGPLTDRCCVMNGMDPE